MNAPVKRHWLDGIEQTVANLCLASLVLILAARVFFRYVLSIGLSWSEEVSFLLVWFVYVSASLARAENTHIRVTVPTGWFPGGQRACAAAGRCLVDLFSGVVVVAGVLLIRQMLQHPVYSTSLFLPLVWIYTVIPLARPHDLSDRRKAVACVAPRPRPVINDTHAAGRRQNPRRRPPRPGGAPEWSSP
ncbi:MAG: TRAP transporter small permease subunit [Burkholderiaceae bacterium]